MSDSNLIDQLEAASAPKALVTNLPARAWTPAGIVASFAAMRFTSPIAGQLWLTMAIRTYGEICAKRALRKWMRKRPNETAAYDTAHRED
ncbi:MAG: hypothetical protein ACM31O_03450 [Bacteroidota bacterium]